MEGDFAFLGDKNFMEVAILDHCEMAMTSLENSPEQYGIGLPNDSPFVHIFSDKYVPDFFYSWKEVSAV